MKKSRLLGAVCACVIGMANFTHTYAASYTIINLGTLSGPYAEAFEVNDSGQVTGNSPITGNNATHAFLYDGGTMQDLGTLEGGTFSWGQGINDSGQVTGLGGTNNGYRAFLYDDGTMQDLGTLGGDYSRGNDINNSGWVAGHSYLEWSGITNNNDSG